MPGLGGITHTDDVDRLHELAPGWVHESFQLGRGPFEGTLSFGQTGRMQFAVKDWQAWPPGPRGGTGGRGRTGLSPRRFDRRAPAGAFACHE